VDVLHSVINGELSPRARVVTAILPALALAAYTIVGLAVFTLLVLGRGGYRRDPEIDARGTSFLLGSHLRHGFFWVMTPVWRLVLATGIPPIALTMLAALLGLASGVAVAAGRFALGGWLFLFSGILDIVDGRVARARNQVTTAGAAVDSVLDRYTDSAMLLGLAWYYRESWVLLPVLMALVGTSLVPYVRAKSEALGRPVRGGLMQRPERIVILGGAVALSPVFEALVFPADRHPQHWMAVVALILVAAASNATALSRFVQLVRALGGTPSAFVQRSRSLMIASGAATVLDFAFVTVIVGTCGRSLAAATAWGCLAGAVANFSMNRIWSLGHPAAPLLQLGRYALVSGVSLLLNAGAVALVSWHVDLHYAWIWWPTRAVVYALWNRPLQRDYVFTDARVSAPAGGELRRS
jgi:phosphatidylglycerophosphate synthase